MSNKLTKNQLDTICKLNKDDSKVIIPYTLEDGSTIDITFKTSLSPDETRAFVNKVVNTCFSPNQEYQPEYKELITFITLLQMLSNVPVPETKDKFLDIDKCYQIMTKTKIMDKIRDMYKSKDTTEQNFYFFIDHLEDLINDRLEFKKQEILITKRAEQDEMSTRVIYSLFDFVADGKQLIKKFSAIADKLDPNSSEFKRITDIIEKLVNNKGIVNPEDFAKAFIAEKAKEIEQTKENDTEKFAEQLALKAQEKSINNTIPFKS